MRMKDLYSRPQKTVSFEFFPPKTPETELKLLETIQELKPLAPSFISVTYGAMGTTRDNTIRLVERIKHQEGIEAAAHLTCAGHTKDEIALILAELKAKGIENLVALRGDPPKGETEFKPAANGFAYASELVQYIRQDHEWGPAFSIAVAGYPEGHVECRNKREGLQHLKIKVAAGADVIITQLFFDNRDFLDFVADVRALGIKIPVIPGIMPVTHGSQIQKFAAMCGAKIPLEIQQAISRFGADQASIEAFGIDYASHQCAELLRAEVAGFHFYTLNKSKATAAIYRNLNLGQSSK
ncbi:MAG: methylenetetrahydrofolate reductase [NAD(P)H] [Omnitrophica bacterium GWA2_52_8]|nr:MAG: methylenetetrahydrofolate reductase [NAD(P)H] [Omnitrophica bacterium GWA2_52_8]